MVRDAVAMSASGCARPAAGAGGNTAKVVGGLPSIGCASLSTRRSQPRRATTRYACVMARGRRATRAVEQPLLLALGAQRERGEPLTLHAPHHHTRGFKHSHELQLRRPANREHSAILPVPRAERCARRVEDEQSRPGRHTTVSKQCDRPAMRSRRHVLGERGFRDQRISYTTIGIVALVLAVWWGGAS